MRKVVMNMENVFEQREIAKAIKYAKDNPEHFSVHLHYILSANPPACFVRDINKGLPIAHVFSQDKELLVSLAKCAGVKRILIEREGTDKQHVDMCGSPLKHLLSELGEDIEKWRTNEE